MTKKCPILSKQIIILKDGTTCINPMLTDCIENDCGVWSIKRKQCGMIH